MELSVSRAIEAAIERTRVVLFRPFDLSKWMHVGFAAWLVSLGENGGGLQLPMNLFSTPARSNSAQAIEEFFRELTRFNWGRWAPILIGAFVGLIAIGLALAYVSCRGRFMLLDNVIRNKMEVRRPWQSFAPEALSLFVWRIVVGLSALAILLIGGGLLAAGLIRKFLSADSLPAALQKLPVFGSSELLLISTGMLAVGLLIVAVFVLLDDFVVVLMWKHRVGAAAAWGRLLPVLFARAPQFAGYLLLKLVLLIGVGIAILLSSVATCCIGLVVLMIPYVNAVILLPVSVFFQLNAVFFLGQIGPDFDALETVPVEEEEAPAREQPEFEGRASDPENPYSPLR